MKKINKSICPSSFARYADDHPKGTWEDFCEDVHAKHEVQNRIYADQRGLCAYCEIRFKPDSPVMDNKGNPIIDLKIEHFHPQSDSKATKNWSLDWQNIMGVCSGGDNRDIDGTGRFSPKKNNRHCDCPKKKNIWDDRILNPLKDIPPFPCLWEVDYDSVLQKIQLKVNSNACAGESSECEYKANGSLQLLHLNCDLLAQFRWAAIQPIEKAISDLIKSGKSQEESYAEVMKIVFNNDASSDWPSFFSTIRAYFGEFAEARLREINYNG